MTTSNTTARFPAIFDSAGFFRDHPATPPLAPFEVRPSTEAEREALYAAMGDWSTNLIKQPQGVLRYPYIVPGGEYDQLWDWDGFFCGLAISEERPAFFQGCVLNFLDHILPDGKTPSVIAPTAPHYESVPLPLIAQWMAIACRLVGDVEWARPWWDRVLRQRQWYEDNGRGRRGLYRLLVWPGHGLDNDPAIYGRRGETVAAVHVNCYHYRELVALAYLAHELGDTEQASQLSARAEALRDSINEFMWDPIDGMYYHLDLSDFEDVRGQAITWEVPYKVRSWACLFPLWAGVATPEQAERMVTEHILNPDEFLSPYGIRSLAANERIYNNEPMGNPSNWQGPVWGMSTFHTAYGLLRYGYADAAMDVASRLIDVYVGDYQRNGVIHEYYHADTGAPIIGPGFLSWNMLGQRVLGDIAAGMDPSRIPTPDAT